MRLKILSAKLFVGGGGGGGWGGGGGGGGGGWVKYVTFRHISAIDKIVLLFPPNRH